MSQSVHPVFQSHVRSRLTCYKVYSLKYISISIHRSLSLTNSPPARLNATFKLLSILLKPLHTLLTMYANNPYAQGGWPNPQNSFSINQTPNASSSDPPTFGALPQTNGGPDRIVRFEFCAFSPDICNCVVVGPNSQRKVFEVRTVQGRSHMRTTVSKENNQIFSFIDWTSHPDVEIRDVLGRTQTRDFLRLSEDQRYLFLSAPSRVGLMIQTSFCVDREG